MLGIPVLFDPYPMPKTTWTLEDALPLVRQIEVFAPDYGCHVALTGGVLYKHGARKDLDLLFYRIRQRDQIDETGLLVELSRMGFTIGPQHGWLTKAFYDHKGVDLFFPERPNSNLDGRSGP